MKMIPVTKQHIADGIAEDCRRCPVALALMDCGYEDADVGVYATNLGDRAPAGLLHSDGLRRWIVDFDEWSDQGEIAAPAPVTLVLLDGEWLVTLPEWQKDRRS